MTQKLFADNVTLEIVQVKPVAVESPVGYMFASRGATLLSPQQQRWVLYKEYNNTEASEFVLRVARLSSRQYTNLDGWTEAMKNKGADAIWKEGATYVKVEASASDTLDLFKLAAAPVMKLSPIVVKQPKPPGDSKPGVLRPVGPDWLLGPPALVLPQLIDRVAIWQNDLFTGHAYGTHWDPAEFSVDGQQVNQECWVLLPGYQTATYKSALTQSSRVGGAELETKIVDVKGTTASMQAFIKEMIEVWKDGSTAINTVCTYYNKIPGSL